MDPDYAYRDDARRAGRSLGDRVCGHRTVLPWRVRHGWWTAGTCIETPCRIGPVRHYWSLRRARSVCDADAIADPRLDTGPLVGVHQLVRAALPGDRCRSRGRGRRAAYGPDRGPCRDDRGLRRDPDRHAGVHAPLEYYIGILGPGGDCYTGASVAGSLTLEAPGKKSVAVPVSGEQKPTSATIHSCPTESEAPFDDVWPRPLVRALGTLLGDRVADAAIADTDPVIRANGVGMLGARPSADVVPILLRLLKDADQTVRAQVTYALRERRPDSSEVIDALIETLSDPSAIVRVGAAEALGEIGAPAARAAPEIIKLATGGDTWTRTAALGAIEHMGAAASAVVPQLIPMLGDADAQVREAAADALGAIGPAASAAVPALTRLLDDPEWYVKDRAKAALTHITGAKPSASLSGCTVPNVKGLTVSEARSMWAKAGFSSSVETVRNDDYRVSDQMPSAGQVMNCDAMPLLVLP